MRYVIAADTRGEMVLCSGEASRMEQLAHRMRQERLFRYVRVADRPPIHHAPAVVRPVQFAPAPPSAIPLVR